MAVIDDLAVLVLGLLIQTVYVVIQVGGLFRAQAKAVVGDALLIAALDAVLVVGPAASEQAGIGGGLLLAQGSGRSVIQLALEQVIAVVGLHLAQGLLAVVDHHGLLLHRDGDLLIQTLVVVIQVGGLLSAQTVAGVDHAVLVAILHVVLVGVLPAAGEQRAMALAVGDLEGHQAFAGVLGLLQLIGVAVLSDLHFCHTLEQDRVVLAVFDGRVVLQPNAVGESVEASGAGDSGVTDCALLLGHIQHLDLAGGVGLRVAGQHFVAVQVGVGVRPLAVVAGSPALGGVHHRRLRIRSGLDSGFFRGSRLGGLSGFGRLRRLLRGCVRIVCDRFCRLDRFTGGTAGGTHFRICQVGGHGRTAQQHGQDQHQGEDGSQFLFQVHDVGASC